jgi:SAM-dependent methyltransferase
MFGPAFDAQWRQRFERFAQRSTKEADVSGWSDVGLAHRVDSFSRLLDELETASGGLVLDLGCGAGTYSRLLARRGHRVVAADYSLPSLGRAVQYDAERASHYVAADAYILPFASSSFTLIVCIGVLQAVGSPELVLDEIVRVLQPGGILVIEGLNARGVAARAGRIRSTLRRTPPRVRHYDPRSVHRWLADRRLQLCARAPIVLPPRSMPGALRWLRLVPGATTFAVGSRLTEAVAHSFLFAARLS